MQLGLSNRLRIPLDLALFLLWEFQDRNFCLICAAFSTCTAQLRRHADLPPPGPRGPSVYEDPRQEHVKPGLPPLRHAPHAGTGFGL